MSFFEQLWNCLNNRQLKTTILDKSSEFKQLRNFINTFSGRTHCFKLTESIYLDIATGPNHYKSSTYLIQSAFRASLKKQNIQADFAQLESFGEAFIRFVSDGTQLRELTRELQHLSSLYPNYAEQLDGFLNEDLQNEPILGIICAKYSLDPFPGNLEQFAKNFEHAIERDRKAKQDELDAQVLQKTKRINQEAAFTTESLQVGRTLQELARKHDIPLETAIKILAKNLNLRHSFY